MRPSVRLFRRSSVFIRLVMRIKERRSKKSGKEGGLVLV
jgi:hypothetical protein